jgi:hypothetical protein
MPYKNFRNTLFEQKILTFVTKAGMKFIALGRL